jgi:hypothetical protein
MRRMLRTLSLTDRTSHAEAEHDSAEISEPREHTAILAPLMKVSETMALCLAEVRDNPKPCTSDTHCRRQSAARPSSLSPTARVQHLSLGNQRSK